MSHQVTGSILVVDDDEILREALHAVLTEAGHSVSLADGADAALGALRDHRPQLMLLDIQMPTVDGFELLARLRQSPEHQRLPVIMTTAVNDAESVIRCAKLGVQGYLLKPLDPLLVRERVAEVLAT